MLPKYRTAHGTGAVRFVVYEPVYFTPEEIALIVDSPMQRRCGNNGSGEANRHGHDDVDHHGNNNAPGKGTGEGPGNGW